MIGISVVSIDSRKDNLAELIDDFLVLNKNNQYFLIIVFQYSSINIEIKSIIEKNNNIDFIFSEKKNLSYCKNLSIKYLQTKKLISWIWFIDDDCRLNLTNLNMLYNKVNSSNYVIKPLIFLIHIKNEKQKIVGNNLNTNKFLSFLALYRAGGPSLIIKKNIIKKLFDEDFGFGGKVINAEDTKFAIDNFTLKVKILSKDLIVFHPLKETVLERIKGYAYGQGYLIKKVNLFHSFLFLLLTLPKTFTGLFISIILLDKSKFNIYNARILYFIKGIFEK